MTLDLVDIMLRNVIYDRLRNKGGDVYAPITYLKYERTSKDSGAYRFGISFDCAPEVVNASIKSVKEEFNNFCAGKLSVDLLEKARAIKKETLALADREKDGYAYILEAKEAFLYGEEMVELKDLLTVVDAITIDDIKLCIARYLTDEAFQEYVIYPEEFKK